jgi:hypothetical protein
MACYQRSVDIGFDWNPHVKNSDMYRWAISSGPAGTVVAGADESPSPPAKLSVFRNCSDRRAIRGRRTKWRKLLHRLSLMLPAPPARRHARACRREHPRGRLIRRPRCKTAKPERRNSLRSCRHARLELRQIHDPDAVQGAALRVLRCAIAAPPADFRREKFSRRVIRFTDAVAEKGYLR